VGIRVLDGKTGGFDRIYRIYRMGRMRVHWRKCAAVLSSSFSWSSSVVRPFSSTSGNENGGERDYFDLVPDVF
jgi:hypothetical protein